MSKKACNNKSHAHFLLCKLCGRRRTGYLMLYFHYFAIHWFYGLCFPMHYFIYTYKEQSVSLSIYMENSQMSACYSE